MTDVRQDAILEGAGLDEAFQVGLRVLQGAGFELWKTRPLGWFAIARRRQDQTVLEANLAVRGGGPIQVSLGLSADNFPEAELTGIAAELLQTISAQVGRGAR